MLLAPHTVFPASSEVPSSRPDVTGDTSECRSPASLGGKETDQSGGNQTGDAPSPAAARRLAFEKGLLVSLRDIFEHMNVQCLIGHNSLQTFVLLLKHPSDASPVWPSSRRTASASGDTLLRSPPVPSARQPDPGPRSASSRHPEFTSNLLRTVSAPSFPDPSWSSCKKTPRPSLHLLQIVNGRRKDSLSRSNPLISPAWPSRVGAVCLRAGSCYRQ